MTNHEYSPSAGGLFKKFKQKETRVACSGTLRTKTRQRAESANPRPHPLLGQVKAGGRNKSSFPKQWTEGGLPVPSSAISQEVGICVPFMGRSVTCPVAHCTLKCTISKPPNLHKMHFSVALLERKRSALPRPQAPWGDRISNKQNCVDIWTMVGPAHSGERAKNSLW